MEAPAESMDIAADLPPRPYPGLRPFAPDEWQLFFGREMMAEEVLRRVSSQRLVVVHGSSGCGKSSLIYAGVIPQLERRRKRRGVKLLTATIRPGRSPVRTLATEVAKLCLGSDRQTDVDTIHRILISGRQAIARLEKELVARDAAQSSPQRTEYCLFIDQFEELFRFAREGDPDEARLFAEILIGLAATDSADPEAPARPSGPGLISGIVTVRSEFLGDCARFPGLAEAVNPTQYLLPRMERADLLRAIREPASLYGGSIDWDLAERLAHDADRENDPLPLVQHALMRLWDLNGKDLKLDHYLAAAAELDGEAWAQRTGLSVILAAHANVVFLAATTEGSAVTPDAAKARQQAGEHVFRALTDIDAEGRATRRPMQLKRLRAVVNIGGDALEQILDAFRADGVSFVTPYRRPGAPPLDDERDVIDISHEALIRSWPRVADPRVDPNTGRPRGWLHQEFQDGLIWRALAVQAQLFANDRKACLDPATTGQREPWYEGIRQRPAWAARYLISRERDMPPEEQPEWRAVSDLMRASHVLREAELKRVQTLERRITRYFAPVAFAALVTALVASSYLVLLTRQQARETEDRLQASATRSALDRQSAETRALNEKKRGDDLQAALNSLIARGVVTGSQATGEDQARAETVPDVVARAFVESSSLGSAVRTTGAIWIGTENAKASPPFVSNLRSTGVAIAAADVKSGGSYTVSKNLVLRDGLPDDGDYGSKANIGIVPDGTRFTVRNTPKKYSRGSGEQYWAEIEIVPDIPEAAELRNWVRSTSKSAGVTRASVPLYEFAITLRGPEAALKKVGRVEYGGDRQNANNALVSSDLSRNFLVPYTGTDCSALTSVKVYFQFGVTRKFSLDPCYAKDPPRPLLAQDRPVDWWAVFKLNGTAFPSCTGDASSVCQFGGTPQVRSGGGQQYVFASSAGTDLRLSSDCAGATANDPVGATFNQIYNEFRHYVVWNDQFYGDPKTAACSGNSCGAPWGHSKGILAWNEQGEGVILQATTPSWPASGSRNAPRTTDGNTLGCTKLNNLTSSQHFFALKLDRDDVIKALKALRNASVVTDPTIRQIVNNGGPAEVRDLVNTLGQRSDSKIPTRDVLSTGVTLISKPSALIVPPWQMVSALLDGAPLRVASWWTNPRIETTTTTTRVDCWDSSLARPGPVEIATSGQWDKTPFSLIAPANHAKVGVSTTGNYAIFGDMNQQGALAPPNCNRSQNGRGGLFFVLDNASLSGNLRNLIAGNTASGGFGIVVGQDSSLKAAQDEVARAQGAGFADPRIYLKDKRYQTVVYFGARAERDNALAAARNISKWAANAQPVTLSTWCIVPDDQKTHRVCSEASEDKE